MRKYLEFFKEGFPSDMSDRTAIENWPYVGHDINGGVVYTVIPAKEEEPEIDLTTPYVTFTAEEDNSSVGLAELSTNQTLEYSTDTTTWNTFNTETNISLNNGDKVYVRGVLSTSNSKGNYTQFKMSGKIAASGNCNAIWNYQDLNAPLKACCGYKMFSDCASLITAPELPATTLDSTCYACMFMKCTSLVTAPVLPAATLTTYCYNNMFYGCTKLNNITCLTTDRSALNCTLSWISGVSSTGTFIKHPDMSNWATGKNGIPSGWTVEDAII